MRALESGQLAGYAGDVWFPQPAPKDHPWRTMPHHGMTPHISGTSLSAQARYAAGTREILECWFEGRPIRNEYLIVDGGKLAGAGAHSYSAGNATGLRRGRALQEEELNGKDRWLEPPALRLSAKPIHTERRGEKPMASSTASETSHGFLDRERIVATPRFNRWLVPPAALAIHLCIGMAYGFSVFWLPMTKLLTGPARRPAPTRASSPSCHRDQLQLDGADVTHIFETFIAMLGISAAIWGGWLEHAGPRKSGFIAALCWGGGLVLGGFGVSIHQLWLVYLGCGFIGGIGQGLGYITPVSTLIKWFPDRRGMATGFAIMGYGGGAMIGSPLAVWLMAHFAHGRRAGRGQTLMVLGAIYFVAMTLGAFGFRVPPAGWRPAGWTPPPPARRP